MKFLAILSVATLATAFPMADPEPIVKREDSLNEKFVAKGKKYFGTCADQGRLSNAQNAAIVKADFGQVTPENRLATATSHKMGVTFARLTNLSDEQHEVGQHRILKGKLQI